MPAAARGEGLAGAYFFVGDVGEMGEDVEDEVEDGAGRDRLDLPLREDLSLSLVGDVTAGASSTGAERWA